MKNIIKQLFCKHEWENLGECRGEGKTYLWIQCFKCNKNKRTYLIKEDKNDGK